FRFDFKTESRGEADGAEQAKFVFFETPVRIADRANNSRVQVGASADEIENLQRIVTHQEPVDGEVAALDVLFGRFSVNHGVRAASVRVAAIGAECCDFDFVAVARNQNHAKLRADGD